jgi:hypothetical protein
MACRRALAACDCDLVQLSYATMHRNIWVSGSIASIACSHSMSDYTCIFNAKFNRYILKSLL